MHMQDGKSYYSLKSWGIDTLLPTCGIFYICLEDLYHCNITNCNPYGICVLRVNKYIRINSDNDSECIPLVLVF